MTKRNIALIAGLLLGGSIFSYLVLSVGLRNVARDITQFGFLPLGGFVSISLLNFCLYTWRWKIIIDDVEGKKRVSFWRLFLHRMSGFAGGYLTPGAQVAGEPVRVAMLVREGYDTRTATSSVVLDLAFEISMFIVYVVAGLCLAIYSGVTPSADLRFPIVFIAILLGVMVTFLVSIARGKGFFEHIVGRLPLLPRGARTRALMTWLHETESLMAQFFRARPWQIALIVVVSFIMTAFRAVEVFWIAFFFGVKTTLFDTVLVSTLPSIAMLLPIPGGVGVYEGSLAALFTLLGLPLNALAFSFIIRVRDAVFIFVGVIHAASEGGKYFENKKNDK